MQKIQPIIPMNKDTVDFKNIKIPDHVLSYMKLLLKNNLNDVKYIPIYTELLKQHELIYRVHNTNYSKVLNISKGIDLYLQLDYTASQDLAKILGRNKLFYTIGFYKAQDVYQVLYNNNNDNDFEMYKSIIANINIQQVNETGQAVNNELDVKSEFVDVRYKPIIYVTDSDEIADFKNTVFNIKQVDDELSNLKNTQSLNYRFIVNNTTIDRDGVFNGTTPYIIGFDKDVIDSYEEQRTFNKNQPFKLIDMVQAVACNDITSFTPKTKMLHLRIQLKDEDNPNSFIKLTIVNSKMLFKRSTNQVIDNIGLEDKTWAETIMLMQLFLKGFYYKTVDELISLLAYENAFMYTNFNKQEIDLLKVIRGKPNQINRLLYILHLIKNESKTQVDNENEKVQE